MFRQTNIRTDHYVRPNKDRLHNSNNDILTKKEGIHFEKKKYKKNKIYLVSVLLNVINGESEWANLMLKFSNENVLKQKILLIFTKMLRKEKN